MTPKPAEQALVPGKHEVVVGVDDSRHTEGAVRWAANTASDRGKSLRIVHALEIGSIDPVLGLRYPDVSAAVERCRLRGEDAVARALRTAHAVDPRLSVETEVVPGSAAKALIRCSTSAYAVVLAASGLGEAGAGSTGSTTAAVAGHAHCPVVVVRGNVDRTVNRFGPVVLGLDASDCVEGAIPAAFDEASLRSSSLVVVYAWSDLRLGAIAPRHELLTPPMDFEKHESKVVANFLAKWQDKYPDVSVTVKVYLDGPREHLVRWSQRAQLVVLGARGRGGFDGLMLGGTTAALVQQARCPVMVVRPSSNFDAPTGRAL